MSRKNMLREDWIASPKLAWTRQKWTCLVVKRLSESSRDGRFDDLAEGLQLVCVVLPDQFIGILNHSLRYGFDLTCWLERDSYLEEISLACRITQIATAENISALVFDS
jgi:hypothetical protein